MNKNLCGEAEESACQTSFPSNLNASPGVRIIGYRIPQRGKHSTELTLQALDFHQKPLLLPEPQKAPATLFYYPQVACFSVHPFCFCHSSRGQPRVYRTRQENLAGVIPASRGIHANQTPFEMHFYSSNRNCRKMKEEGGEVSWETLDWALCSGPVCCDSLRDLGRACLVALDFGFPISNMSRLGLMRAGSLPVLTGSDFSWKSAYIPCHVLIPS